MAVDKHINDKQMNRQGFIKQGLYGLGALISVPPLLQSCINAASQSSDAAGACASVSPTETKGPFPIQTPSDLVQSNIVSDREGIPLLIQIQVQNKNQNCQPLAGALVDVWHCDADGAYSEYGGNALQRIDYSNAHFLRGRQRTDANGRVSFVSIYPGSYPGRAPHIHLEVLDSSQRSLLISQIAFPEEVSNTVYATAHYQGQAKTANTRDALFADSLAQNLADAVTGNPNDGYTLVKTLVVNG